DPVVRAAEGTLRASIIDTGSVTRTAPTLSPGIVNAAADELREEEADAASGNDGNLSLSAPVAGSPGTLGCGERAKGRGNVRVNQDCSFRRQAEEGIAFNPTDAQRSFFLSIPTFSRQFIVVEDNNPAVFHDKPFIAADVYQGSPNRDNVYVTWTVFKFSPTCGPQPNPSAAEQYCSSPIFGA